MSLTKVSYSMIAGASVNVLDYGADPTGVADSTAAFNLAIATQIPVYVPEGNYTVSKFNNIAFDGFTLFGEGTDKTIITTNNATDDLFTVGNGVTLFKSFNLKDVTFKTSVTKTAGYVVAANKIFGTSLLKINVNGYFGVCDLYACQLTTLRDIHAVLFTPTTGKAISARSDGTSSNLIIDNFAADGGTGTQPYAGLYVEQWDGVFLINSQFNRCGNGLVFNPPATKNFDHMFCTNTTFDTCTGSGITIAAGGGTVRRLRFVNSWSGSNGNNGIYVEPGAIISGLHFADGMIVSNGTNGIFFDTSANDVNDIQIVGTLISGNSRTTSNAFPGIRFRSTLGGTYENIQIVGCKIGVADEFLNTQKYAIEVFGGAPPFDGFVLTGNNFLGNLTGAANFSTSGFTNRSVTGNVGLVTQAVGSVTQLAANTSVVVTHGCFFTPLLGNITCTAGTSWTSAATVFITNITSTTFTINTNVAPGLDLVWGWQVNIQ